jgi:hypothetical protein
MKLLVKQIIYCRLFGWYTSEVHGSWELLTTESVQWATKIISSNCSFEVDFTALSK